MNGGRDMMRSALGSWKKYGEKPIKYGLDVVNRAPNPSLKLFWKAVKQKYNDLHQRPGKTKSKVYE
jgi:hypothetical protein